MKRITAFVGVAALVLSASSAHAATIDYSLLGVEDYLVGGFDNVGNSEAEEADFLFDYLVSQGYSESDLTYQKIDVNGQSSFVEVLNDPTGTNLWAIDFSTYGVADPLVFLVKFGNAVYEHYLYENLANTQYGVVDLSDITAANGRITIMSISHTGTVSGPMTVPEPPSGSLMLFALAALTAARRRNKNAPEFS
jgi:hypothetical protein